MNEGGEGARKDVGYRDATQSKKKKIPYKANPNCALPRFAPSISLPVCDG